MVKALEECNFKWKYMAGFPGLKKDFYVHLRLVKDYMPKLFSHFVRHSSNNRRAKE